MVILLLPFAMGLFVFLFILVCTIVQIICDGLIDFQEKFNKKFGIK